MSRVDGNFSTRSLCLIELQTQKYYMGSGIRVSFMDFFQKINRQG